jgi:transcriptional regulator with XRE-family HTH domain
MFFSPSNLKVLRERSGPSREQVAVLIGRTAQMVQYYEGGRAIPPVGVLLILSELFGCELADFFERQQEVAAP